MAIGFQHKIVDLPRLRAAVEEARTAGKTVVQCHGCFDIVHPGHIRYLEFARRQGDLLFVTLTGDAAMSKGLGRPYIPEELRAENLAALVFVDFVHVNAAPTAEDVLETIRPDIYLKGREYENSTDPGFLAEKAVVERYGGRILFSSGEIVFSSTALIEQLPPQRELESHRLNLLCRRHRIHGEELLETLERFRDLRVVVVGDVILDRYVLCDALGVASESPMLSLVQRDERTYIGGAAIVARHAAALGARSFLLSAGAEDERTRGVLELLASEGVECQLLPVRKSLVEKTRYLADDAKLFKLDRAELAPLDSVAERRAATILAQQSRGVDVVLLCDFGYGMITGGLIQRVLPTLRQNARIIAGDVSGGRGNLLNFRNLDLLCPTEREVRAALHDYDSGLSTVAWNVLGQTQARHLIVTLDKRGMVVFERPAQDRSHAEWSGRLKSEQLPSFADRTVDKMGCGDALLTAAAMTLAAGGSLMHAAYLGNAAAALKLARLGNAPVEADELREWLRQRRELNMPGRIPADMVTV
jgi:rfaE bifunctional protein kinase chain/domain/rfaE bifunctional protein nucleotidyltransferase chain/domain